MARPSKDTDQKLINAARIMLPETGLSGLRLRDVARRARVNLGMFHYHFGSKEAFARRLLQDIYEDFFGKLSLESRGEGRPLERLSRSLIVVGRFMREQRRLAVMLMQEVLVGHKECVKFARENTPRHAAVIAGLIREGQAARQIKPIPLPMAMAFAMGGMGAPNIVITMLERAGSKRPFGMTSKDLEKLMLSDRALEQRVELIISGLAVHRSRRRP